VGLDIGEHDAVILSQLDYPAAYNNIPIATTNIATLVPGMKATQANREGRKYGKDKDKIRVRLSPTRNLHDSLRPTFLFEIYRA
jgi:hypothetical protein